MYVSPKKDCPHVIKDNLIPLEKFKDLPFYSLKCQNCEEKEELWICLICGQSFCSRYKNSHFLAHNQEKPDHLLCLGIMDLSVWCCECTNDNADVPKEDRGCYIVSELTNQYVKEYSKFKFYEVPPVAPSSDVKIEKKSEFKLEKELCPHALNDGIIDEIDPKNFFNNVQEAEQLVNKTDCLCFCLSCMELMANSEDLNKHYDSGKHRLYFNIFNQKIICKECKSEFEMALTENIFKYRLFFHYMNEGISVPNAKLLSKQEIFEVKYKKFVDKFKQNKYSKILFMVGAGISTSAGIPDFRSKTGLFKQLQDKYKLSSPEEFFYISTFLKKPQYFYEFTKLFDLSQIKPTIAHEFMNFFVSKNLVKYVFTQNIDGLEKKAKIPDNKLIFAHGNFYTGHCAKCKKEIDIKKINEGIEKGKIYYCPDCKGPCKPNVVFYGENLPDRFYEEQQKCKDVDLIIIMGTSLKVQPFASIPLMTNPYADIMVFNMEEVGSFFYNKIYCNHLFVAGKTDENIIKFLKDTDMLNEFKTFLKKEYNEDFKEEDYKDSLEKLSQGIDNLNLNK